MLPPAMQNSKKTEAITGRYSVLKRFQIGGFQSGASSSSIIPKKDEIMIPCDRNVLHRPQNDYMV